MVYVAISSESSAEETSDAIKKIIFNYLQCVSLAAGIPLEWTTSVEEMFEWYAAVSSAGSSLLIPDCELTHVPTAKAFYMKQLAFTFLVPFVVFVCIASWAIIYAGPRLCCSKRRKCGAVRCVALPFQRVKSYCILSVTLGVFVLYPMLIRLSFDMVKCPRIGTEGSFLMADLQERCFGARHLSYFLALTVPQLILYVAGLPVLGTILILRNRDILHQQQFRMRFGLLYLGYREGREWWELIITLRKVLVVAIATFGTIFVNSVHMQAYLALLVVFLSIVLHLGMQPFDTAHRRSLELHNLEFAGLTVSWFTFFIGLLFFQGEQESGSVSKGALGFLSAVLVGSNMVFFIVATVVFLRAYRRDRRIVIKRHTLLLEERKKRLAQAEGGSPSTAVVPIDKSGETGDVNEDAEPITFHHVPSAMRVGHTRSTVRKVHSLHVEHKLHEERLAKLNAQKQLRSKRRTELRVMARQQLLQSRALCKLDVFATLPASVIEEIVEEMSFSKYPKGTTIVRQGEIADRFFVLTRGVASAWVARARGGGTEKVGEAPVAASSPAASSPAASLPASAEIEGTNGKNQTEASRDLIQVGTLQAISCFGESAILGYQGSMGSIVALPPQSPPIRSATVIVESDSASLLILSAGHFNSVVASMGQAKDLVMGKVQALAEARAAMNAQKNTGEPITEEEDISPCTPDHSEA